jgi:hypothetical protein
MDHACRIVRWHMTKCVGVLRATAKAESMDQSQARIKTVRSPCEPVIGPCFLLLRLLVTLERSWSYQHVLQCVGRRARQNAPSPASSGPSPGTCISMVPHTFLSEHSDRLSSRTLALNSVIVGGSSSLAAAAAAAAPVSVRSMPPAAAAAAQGLTLVHFSAQLERCLWDRGCA